MNSWPARSAAIVLTYSAKIALAARMCAFDGLMACPFPARPMNSSAVLRDLRGTPHHRPTAARNAMLRKFDTGLNTQITQIDEEMRLAARLQVDSCRAPSPNSTISASTSSSAPLPTSPADIYDVARLDEDHRRFFVADAVGHGMPAALLTIFLKRTLLTKKSPH